MIILPLLVVIVIGVVVYLATRSGSTAAPGASSRPARTSRIPVYAEAIGYIGGMLALGGLLTVLGSRWTDLAEPVRLALSGGGAAVLLGAGFVLPAERDPAFERLRSVAWLAATAATAVFTGVFVADVLDVERGQAIALGCALAVAIESALLWRGRTELPLQQFTALAATPVVVGTFVTLWTESGPAGIAVWATGAALVAVAIRRTLPANPALTVGIGAIAAIFGAAMAVDISTGPGFLFLLATATGIVALALVPGLAPGRAEQITAGIIGGFGMLQAVPAAITHFGRDAGAATGIVVWTVGVALIALGASGRVRVGILVEAFGALATIGGAALTWTQWHGAAPLIGIASATALIALGTRPGRILLSAFGSLGLLINVPWAIGWFFPGEGRAPLLISVSGLLLVAIALFLARSGSRWRHELGGENEHPGVPTGAPPAAPDDAPGDAAADVPTGAAAGPA